MNRVNMRNIFWVLFFPLVASCGVVGNYAGGHLASSKFPAQAHCKGVRSLLVHEDGAPSLYCFSKNIVDGKRGEKKESVISRSISGGHSVTSVGAFYILSSNTDVDMRGFGVYSNRHLMGGVRIGKFGTEISNVHVHNGIINGIADVFAIGGDFRDIQDESYLLDSERYDCSGNGVSLQFENMAVIGTGGNVVANDSGVINSSLFMAQIYYSGLRNLFQGNKYVVTNEGLGFEIGKGNQEGLVFQSSKPILQQFIGSVASYDHASGLYLSCADNAMIDGNIFSSLKGRPDVPAIVLKRSRNVRITNNTFEGFAMPVLMDKFSSIIDARGNVIKPNVTADSPESLLYQLKMEPEPVTKISPGKI